MTAGQLGCNRWTVTGRQTIASGIDKKKILYVYVYVNSIPGEELTVFVTNKKEDKD
jgi:hypothetical protein